MNALRGRRRLLAMAAVLMALAGCGSSAAQAPAIHGAVMGISTGPLPPAAPDAALDVVVVDNGVHAADAPALAEARQVLDALDGPGLRDLHAYVIRLEIIPVSRKLTDLPDFAYLRGQLTFDGRSYASIRAVGPVVSGGVITYATGEEQVVPGEASAYGPGFALAHETGHVVRHFALDPAQESALKAAYASRRAAGGPWLTDYAGSNDDEYFADATAAWFGHPWSDSTEVRFSRDWLKANDPALYALLASVYTAS